MSGAVLLERDGPVAVVTLNRPERLNAIGGTLMPDLLEALRAVEADESVRAAVLTGAGRAFCSGDDLREFGVQARTPQAARAHIEAIQDSARLIVTGSKPYVAAARGWAVGGGLEWLIDCDLAVLAEGTRCFFPEVRWGMLVTGGATQLLPCMVGLVKARELILFGERFDAAAALAMGLAWRVVPDADLMATALEAGRRLAALPARGVRDTRRALVAHAGLAFDDVLAREAEATIDAFLDPATAEHIRAFTERAT